MEAVYDPACFNARDIEQAKQIILTPEGGRSTGQRWQQETPYLLSLLEQSIALNADSIVLDYGCGIGRMAKALIDKYQCQVIGVDISPNMRALSASYVNSEKFFACSPESLELIDLRCNAALAIWTLQHCFDLNAEVERISCNLKPRGRLFMVNDRRRLVPTDRGWVDDRKSAHDTICDHNMRQLKQGVLDPGSVGDLVAAASYWATYERF